MVGAEAVHINTQFGDSNPHFTHQLDEIVYIQYVRDVMHNYFFICQQCGTDDLQHFILGSLRMNVAFQAMSSLYYE